MAEISLELLAEPLTRGLFGDMACHSMAAGLPERMFRERMGHVELRDLTERSHSTTCTPVWRWSQSPTQLQGGGKGLHLLTDRNSKVLEEQRGQNTCSNPGSTLPVHRGCLGCILLPLQQTRARTQPWRHRRIQTSSKAPSAPTDQESKVATRAKNHYSSSTYSIRTRPFNPKFTLNQTLAYLVLLRFAL